MFLFDIQTRISSNQRMGLLYLRLNRQQSFVRIFCVFLHFCVLNGRPDRQMSTTAINVDFFPGSIKVFYKSVCLVSSNNFSSDSCCSLIIHAAFFRHRKPKCLKLTKMQFAICLFCLLKTHSSQTERICNEIV